MRGQLSFFMRPILLVMIVVMLIILLVSIYSQSADTEKSENTVDFMMSGTYLPEILSNSADCAAYKSKNSDSLYGYVLDKEKLDEFADVYADIEPLCARSYAFGWRASVKELKPDGSEAAVWEFGASNFSKGPSVRSKRTTGMNVAIRYSGDDIRVGRIDVLMVDGDLERLAGFVDSVCESGESARANFRTELPIIVNGKEACILYGKEILCRKLLCDATGDSPKTKGDYILSAKVENGTVILSA